MLNPSPPCPPRVLVIATIVFFAAACDISSSGYDPTGACPAPHEVTDVQRPSERTCTIPASQLYQGCIGKDCIPALTDPALLRVENVEYLEDRDRVIGFEIDGRSIAVPHRILWWHEIANFHFMSRNLAVTYCPLTGSSMAFDVSSTGATFGVSGLLFQNNLIMYDRSHGESLWSQMQRKATCGSRRGQVLPLYPVIEMTWAGWRALHPDGEVVSTQTCYQRDYTRYPYGSYEEGEAIGYPMPELDYRRFLKERVLGIPDGDGGGIAFPFGVLDEGAAIRVVESEVGEEPVVVFWERDREAAAAFRPVHQGDRLHFMVRDGRIVDAETASAWRLDGTAVSGPLAGTRLAPVAEAYVAFWFAWAVFHPDTQLWTGASERPEG